ncbi:hypothetical protein EI94DRAFT_1705549 [Lactarius quietus]|nr:hypothetical protein EI94DRAFT_1705549 [Lactarius quietus]
MLKKPDTSSITPHAMAEKSAPQLSTLDRKPSHSPHREWGGLMIMEQALLHVVKHYNEVATGTDTFEVFDLSPSCMHALTQKSVTYLATTYNGIIYPPFPILKVFDFCPIGTHITAQGTQLPWDDRDNWEDGLQSLSYLKCFLLRSWQSLREGNGVEDLLVCQWLIFSPPELCNVIVWTGAHQDQGCLVRWQLNDRRGGWENVFEQASAIGTMSEFSEQILTQCPMLEIEEIFDQLEIESKETFSTIKKEKLYAHHLAKEIRMFGSTLKEHETVLHNSIRAISHLLEQGLIQMSSQLLKGGWETGPEVDCCDSIHRNAMLLEGRIWENLEQMSLWKSEGQC